VRALTDTRAAAQLLASLHAEAQRAGWAAVERAKRAGDFIRQFPPGPRGRLLREAGVPARTASLYVHVAEHWPEIQQQFAQRDALSLRGLIAGTRKAATETAPIVYTVALDAVDPTALAKILEPFHNRSARVTIRLNARRARDPKQLELF
jgi:hypothetical protein